MQLTDAQKQAVSGWVLQGLGIGDIQKLLAREFQLSITYMDARFLLIDLGLEVKDRAAPRAAPDLKNDALVPPEPARGGGPRGPAPEAPGALPAGGRVSVEIDRLMKPGFLVSGSVTFSDGVRASWMLDQHGRLALDAGRPGYRPPASDIQEFQVAVSRELEKQGY